MAGYVDGPLDGTETAPKHALGPVLQGHRGRMTLTIRANREGFTATLCDPSSYHVYAVGTGDTTFAAVDNVLDVWKAGR